MIHRPWLSPGIAPLFEHFSGFGREVKSAGRWRVKLHVGHPYANQSGWQWRGRLVMFYALGMKLPESVHVHHRNGDMEDDRLENLALIGWRDHGKLHSRGQPRDDQGRWTSA